MQELNDIATIRRAFSSVSRWRIMASAFYRPTSYYLADLYLGLTLSVLTAIAALKFGEKISVLWTILPISLILWRIHPALKSIYPQLTAHADTAHQYREDFQFLRLNLFINKLRVGGISTRRVTELRDLIRLEAERTAAHPPPINRPAFAIPLTLLVGILAAGAGLEKFWINGYYAIVLAILVVVLFISYQFLELLHPPGYYAKELEIFLEVYCRQGPIRDGRSSGPSSR